MHFMHRIHKNGVLSGAGLLFYKAAGTKLAFDGEAGATYTSVQHFTL
jgi:hypothetical protein